MPPENQTENQTESQDAEPENTGQDQQEEAVDYQSKWQAQRKVNKDLERKLDDARKAADQVEELKQQLAEAQGNKAEYEQAQHDKQITVQALDKANQRILQSEIRAAATGKLADPNDALKFMDISGFTVSDDGEVDRQAIGAAIDELVAGKPYLAKGEAPAGPTGIIPPSGSRDGDRHAGQLKREDIKTMTPKQIVEAQNKGLLDDLLGRKHR